MWRCCPRGCVAQGRWILAALRHRRFFSLAELNAAVSKLLDRLNTRPFRKLPGSRRSQFEQLDRLNTRPFRKLPGSRRSQFEQLDRPALRPLPSSRYVFAEWKTVRVHIDYHVRRAKLKHDACIEDIDFRHRRGLDKQLVLSLADGCWVREHLNVLICGPTGIGKSWIGCALAHSACRNGHSALYVRVSRLLSALAIARARRALPEAARIARQDRGAGDG